MTLYSTAAEREDAERLLEICSSVVALPLSRKRALWNSLKALPSNTPLQADYCWQPALAIELDRVLRNGYDQWEAFDIIHVEHLRGARYALHAKQLLARSNQPATPVVWDSVDSISLLFSEAAQKSEQLFGRAVTRFELKRTERYEAMVAEQLSHILLTSQRDKEKFVSLLPPEASTAKEASIHVIPNGVDLEYFQPGASIVREPASLVVSGKMSYHANIAMVHYLVREIMPLVWAGRPDARLSIVGKDPGSDIQNLAQHPQIEVTGYVEDMRHYLQRATAAIAPLTYGAGIQNKVLEAMACATPVVTSPSALKPLSAVAGRDLLVANSPEEYAKNILTLLNNPIKSREIGWNGRRFVEANHDWDRTTADLERVYQGAIDQQSVVTEALLD